jgi:tRNA pseudouridine55 synthase
VKEHPLHGVLVIDKPSGPTSHDVVAATRRALGLRRVGHTGTLDPMASGVLPLVLGQATRLARFLSGSRKAYLARVRLGAATDTYDADGRIQPGPPRRAVAQVTAAEIEEALAAFRGTFFQQPPPFSAKKVDGVRAYTLARQQQSVTLDPVSVTVYELELGDRHDDEIALRVVCSAGFYVRTLAHEIGARLGTGGYLSALRRIESAGFGERDAVAFASLSDPAADVAARVVPLDRLLPEMPAVCLSPAGLQKARQGRDLGPADLVDATGRDGSWPAWVRLLDPEGHLLALAEPRGVPAVLHPSVVLK